YRPQPVPPAGRWRRRGRRGPIAGRRGNRLLAHDIGCLLMTQSYAPEVTMPHIRGTRSPLGAGQDARAAPGQAIAAGSPQRTASPGSRNDTMAVIAGSPPS